MPQLQAQTNPFGIPTEQVDSVGAKQKKEEKERVQGVFNLFGITEEAANTALEGAKSGETSVVRDESEPAAAITNPTDQILEVPPGADNGQAAVDDIYAQLTDWASLEDTI